MLLQGATVTLDKFTTATTWTNVPAASGTVVYSAGATLRVIKDGTKYRVYYNNLLVGAEATISDATLIDNTIHGLFSTYASNSFDNFTLWPRGSGATTFTSAPFEELMATRSTTTTYNNSTGSVQLVAAGTDANYLQSMNVTDTSTYNLIAYAYTNGAAVTAADLSLYYDTATLTTTYTPMGGTGWYKLTGSFTGVNAAKDYGVRVKAGKTVYVDEMKVQVGVGTAQTFYVMNTGTGVTGLNVQGVVNGTQSGVATFTKAGTISDADFANPVDGMMGIDSADNGRIYFRYGGAWHYAAQSGGFQIPNYEAGGLSVGDYLMPYVESTLSDGAVHGMYQKLDLNKLLATQGAITFKSSVEFQGPTVFKLIAEFFDKVIFHNDVTFAGKTKFNKDTAGTAIISTYSDHVDVKFSNIYKVAPVVNINLIIDTNDKTFIEDGQKAYLSNVTTEGFSIMLPTLALRDFTYNWIAINIDEENITKSKSVIQQIIDTITPTATITPTPSTDQKFLVPTETPMATDSPTLTPTP